MVLEICRLGYLSERVVVWLKLRKELVGVSLPDWLTYRAKELSLIDWLAKQCSQGELSLIDYTG